MVGAAPFKVSLTHISHTAHPPMKTLDAASADPAQRELIVDRLKSIWRDLVYAGRSLAKARGFTLVCVASLGIGMTPVLAVPYWARVFTTAPEAVKTEGLVEVITTPVGPRNETDKWSYPDYLDLRNADTGVTMTAWVMEGARVSVQPADTKTVAQVMFVSLNYFETLGVTLARGAGFGGTRTPVVVVAHRFWEKRFNQAPDVLGKTLTLNGVPHDIVGVAPQGFEGHLGFQDAELFVPLEQHPRMRADGQLRFDRSKEWLHIHGRLLPGVAIGQASAVVLAVTAHLAKQFQATNEFKSGVVVAYHPIGGIEGRSVAIILALWQTIMLAPLIVVCLNISGMMLVRGAIRERELSIRQAIGASRRRLLQHLLAEAVLLAAVGGVLASLILFSAPSVIAWLIDEPIPVQMENALRVDFWMVAVSVMVCLLTSLLFGWLPAARFSRPDISTVLKDEAGAGGVRVGRVHRVTAALQVALAVPLLVLSGTSLDRMRVTTTANLGFDLDLLYAAPLKLNVVTNDDARLRRVRESLANSSGVASVTVADGLPLDARHRTARVSVVTDANVAPRVHFAHVTRVGDRYLDTMGIPLLRGRTFTADDTAGGELVTVISKALAEELFRGADASSAIGQQLTFSGGGNEERSQRTLLIVGVAADFPTSRLDERAQLLLPMAQHPDVRKDTVRIHDDRDGAATVMLIARSAPGEPPLKTTTTLENAMREVDPDFDAARITTGVWLRENMTNDFLGQSMLAGISGGVILLLSALGIYGVVGLMVSTRTREIAVRVTLGASRPRVIGMIVFDVVKLVAPGIVVGLLVAGAIVHLDGGTTGIPLSKLEPLAYVVGAAITLLIVALASLPPARRAASVQPMEALRSS